MAGKVGEVQVTEEALELAEIEVAPAEVRQVREEIVATGTVKTGGNQVAKVTPHVAGEVVEIFALPGAQVQAGQVLARMVSPELARAQASYRQAASRVKALQADLERKRQLAKLGQYGSEELEDSRSRAVEAERGVYMATRSVAESEADVAEAKSNLQVLQHQLEQAETELKVRLAASNRAESIPELTSLQQLERLRADVDRARADVATAKARIAEGRARLNSAQSALETVKGEQPLAEKELGIRRQALSREEKVFSAGYSRRRELLEAESALDMALAELNGAAETVTLLGGEPGGNGETFLHSPIKGKVEQSSLTLGEHVDTEQVCFTVIDLEKVWVELAVAPKDISKIEVGDEVEIRSDSGQNQGYRALVTSVGAMADPTTKTVPVLAAVENSGGRLAAGSYVKGVVVTDTRLERLTVPKRALQEHTGRATLYIAKPEEKGSFEVRHVTLGVEGEDWREIADGLNPGEPLATNGTFYLKSEALKSALSDGCCAVGE
jgi:RND family efflux transporter MFP subunit